MGLLGMERSIVDPCVLMKRKNGQLTGAIILQVDDGFGLGTPDFIQVEYNEMNYFLHKPVISMNTYPPRFNVLTIMREVDVRLMIEKHEMIEKLVQPSGQKEFNSVRAFAQYVGVQFRTFIRAR